MLGSLQIADGFKGGFAPHRKIVPTHPDSISVHVVNALRMQVSSKGLAFRLQCTSVAFDRCVKTSECFPKHRFSDFRRVSYKIISVNCADQAGLEQQAVYGGFLGVVFPDLISHSLNRVAKDTKRILQSFDLLLIDPSSAPSFNSKRREYRCNDTQKTSGGLKPLPVRYAPHDVKSERIQMFAQQLSS